MVYNNYRVAKWGGKHKATKKHVWLAFLFPVLFLGDILYGLLDYYGFSSPVSPGILLRGLALLLSVIMMLRYRNCLPNNLFRWGMLATLFILPSFIYSLAVGWDTIRDVNYILRSLYGPFMIFLVVILTRIYSITTNELLSYLELVSYLLGITLLLSRLMGIQRLTYGAYAYGNTGIFYGQNDLSLAFGLALLAASYRLVNSFSVKRCILHVLSMWSCLQIGTKASIAVILINALFTITLALWGRTVFEKGRYLAHRQNKRFVLGIIVSSLMIGLSIYGMILQSQTSYQRERIETILGGKMPRSVLITAGMSYFKERNFLLNLTGEGMISYMTNIPFHFEKTLFVNEKNVEVDLIDFVGAYGIFFAVIMHFFFFALLYSSFKHYLKTYDGIYGVTFIAIAMYTGHSLFAGHAMFSPIPTTLIAGYTGIYFRSLK